MQKTTQAGLQGTRTTDTTEVNTVVEALKSAVGKTASLATSIKGAVKIEPKTLKKELDYIIHAANYLKTNWKTAVPVIAAVGASGFLLSLKSKKNVVKKGTKLAKKAKKVVKKLAKK